jgi:activator of 2-hydroxyglutaryl-CoA dehydratase
LVLFDNEGNYNNYRSNTSCAAGTGSFLDQQALRLNLNGIAELSTIALSNKSKAPKIASRCAVFAKTDLIHAQQEGYSVSEIADGLCEGLARNITDTLFTVEKPEGSLIMAGGVAKNQRVVEYLEKQIDKPIVVNELSSHFESIGAALYLIDSDITLDRNFESFEDILKEVIEEKN